MRLNSSVYETVRKNRGKVFFANRQLINFWNSQREVGEMLYYSGWYWYIESVDGYMETDQYGPFHSMSAAYKDCFLRSQMWTKPDNKKRQSNK